MLEPSLDPVMKDIASRLKKVSSLGSGGTFLIEPEWLTGKLLVAMPGVSDPRFTQTVIYICSHGPNGAMGLVINRIFAEADFGMLLEQLNIPASSPTPDVPIQFGGPVEMGRGFVLHSSDYLREGTTRIDDAIAITATVEIIQDVAGGRGPERLLMALGYAGWEEGQLEQEMKNNGWLTVAADEDILFDSNLDRKWDRAIHKIGISPAMLSQTAGHA